MPVSRNGHAQKGTGLKRLEQVAYLIDLYRVFPRVFLVGYGFLCWKASLWFMALDKPSAEQAAFVTLLAGFFVPLTNFYMQNGVNRGSKEADAVAPAAPPKQQPYGEDK